MLTVPQGRYYFYFTHRVTEAEREVGCINCHKVTQLVGKRSRVQPQVVCFLLLIVLVTKLYLTLCDPMDVAHQAPLSLGFPRQEYWSGLPFTFPSMYVYIHIYQMVCMLFLWNIKI